MFYLKFVWEDSSVTTYFVSADSVESAINTVLNKTKLSSNPKFVIAEQPSYFQSDSDMNLIREFDEIELQGGGTVYKFKNKLAETITIDGITITKGSLFDILGIENLD